MWIDYDSTSSITNKSIPLPQLRFLYRASAPSLPKLLQIIVNLIPPQPRQKAPHLFQTPERIPLRIEVEPRDLLRGEPLREGGAEIFGVRPSWRARSSTRMSAIRPGWGALALGWTEMRAARP